MPRVQPILEGAAVDTRETDVLRGYLEQGRHHVLGILEGLSDQQLQQPVLPSGWSCLGLVNHLAIDVERFWFRAVTAGDRSAWDSFDAADRAAWDVAPDASPAAVLARYREEARLADEIISNTALDATPAAWPEGMFGSFRLADLREVILHVITETACHAGHLDAARELLDRRQWVVLDSGR